MMRSEVFYGKSLREHFKTTKGFTKKGWLAKQAVAFICENYLGIHIDPRIDDVCVVLCIIQPIWDVILSVRLDFEVNGVLYYLRIQQFVDDNDIIKVEDNTPKWMKMYDNERKLGFKLAKWVEI